MQVTDSSRELTKVEQYLMTIGPKIMKLSSLQGSVVEIEAYCYFIDTDSDGKETELLSIMTPGKEVYATNSKAFLHSFRDIIDCFGRDGFSKVLVDSGVSKAGRTYIIAGYVG